MRRGTNERREGMTVLIRQGRRCCNARCYNGKVTTKCKCICGGKNHSKGIVKAVEGIREKFGMKARALYEFVGPQEYPPALKAFGDPLVIRDTGHLVTVSLTNDAENVVADLVANELLAPGRRLFYYDSEGQLDEIVVENGKFKGFQAGLPGMLK